MVAKYGRFSRLGCLLFCMLKYNAMEPMVLGLRQNAEIFLKCG